MPRTGAGTHEAAGSSTLVKKAIQSSTQGSITVLIEDANGQEIIVAHLNEGDFFSEMGLFG